MRNDELLHHDLAVYVFNDSVTRNEILRMNHDDFEADHFTYTHIKTAIRRKYYWLKMLKEMTKYVCICSNCQQVQMHHYKMNDWSEFLLMTAFAYNNNVHVNIKKTSHEFLKKYTASFAKTSENKALNKKTLLTMKWAE